MQIGVVIAAAGQGKRMGGHVKKQFIELAGKAVLLHTVELFSCIDGIVETIVVTAAEDVDRTRALLKEYPNVRVVTGGTERQDSVYLGLCALQNVEYVLIHDGARPFVSREVLDRLIYVMKDKGAAVLAVPVKDTIKQVDERGVVVTTPPRKSLWAVQTPQAFHLSTAMEAHKRARIDGFVGTDDASLLERLGQTVMVVEGEYTNIKLTTPEDVVIGETILKQRK